MLGNLSGWHVVILFAIILLLFGAPKLPALARSVGQSMRILKTEVAPDADAAAASKTESAAASSKTESAAAASKTESAVADEKSATTQ